MVKVCRYRHAVTTPYLMRKKIVHLKEDQMPRGGMRFGAVVLQRTSSRNTANASTCDGDNMMASSPPGRWVHGSGRAHRPASAWHRSAIRDFPFAAQTPGRKAGCFLWVVAKKYQKAEVPFWRSLLELR